MIPPLVSFITWNRMGLTVRNMSALLDTTDDFELHIVDNNSQDDTWAYINDLKDGRIKSKTRFDINRGPIYAVNYNLSKRRGKQYFIAVDSDVNIHTADWVSKFLQAFDEFPEVGLLGAVSQNFYDQFKHPIVKKEKNGIYYLQLHKGFVEGCCQCFRPGVFNYLGYWSEENCIGDVEMTFRTCNYTPYKAGFLPAVEIDQLQSIPCSSCKGLEWCSLDRGKENCFTIRDKKYSNPQFRNLYGWKKYRQFVKDVERGQRSAFCASIHDEQSMRNHYYNRHMAEENFDYYIKHAN